MPMIDVYATAGTFGDPHALAQKLASELMAIEEVPNIPMFRKNTAAFGVPGALGRREQRSGEIQLHHSSIGDDPTGDHRR